MASASTAIGIGDVGGELQQLKNLHDSGILSLPEFIRSSRDVTETNRSNSQAEAHGADEEKSSQDDDDEDLPRLPEIVDEDGRLLSRVSPSLPSKGGSTPHHSPVVAAKRPVSPTAGVVFAAGNRVLHDLLGEANVRKLAAPDDPDGKINIEWSRSGKTKQSPLIILNRWVLPSSLKKLWSSPRVDQPPAENPRGLRQEGLYGAAPNLAAIEHERAAKMKGPVGPRGRSNHPAMTKESKVPISQRIAEFPEQGLVSSAGVLFCTPCKEQLPNIKSSISDHIGRKKHRDNFAKYVKKHADDDELKELLSEHFYDNPDQTGTSTSAATYLYRYRCVKTFMSSGTPLERLDRHRTLLQRAGFPLTDCSHMKAMYIPRIEAREIATIKSEFSNQFVGIHFDGTTRLGEAVAMTGRYCTADFVIRMQLLSFRTTESHLNAPGVASLLTSELGKLGIPPTMVVNVARDSASTNGAACNLMLANPLIHSADSLCISHTISNAGQRLELPMLTAFTTPWLELVGGRDPHRGAQRLWKSMVAPQVVPGYSKVRWWSKAEIWFVMAENFGCLEPFIRLLRDRRFGDATTTSMANILAGHSDTLRLELAAVLDARVLVSTTYAMEGDRLEMLLVYRRIEELRARGRALASNEDGAMPNVDAVLREKVELKNGLVIAKSFPGHGTFNGRIVSSAECDSTMYPGRQRVAYRVKYPSDGAEEDLEEEEIRPLVVTVDMPERKRMADVLSKAFEYLESRITGTCENIYDCSEMYEVCRLLQVFDPQFAVAHATPAFVDGLAAVKGIAAHVDLQKLKDELPTYLTRAVGFLASATDVADFSNSVLGWWKSNDGKNLSEWSKAARIAFAMSPNSASCERVFSLLQLMFGDQQMAALADYIQAALMLRYNGRSVG